MGGLGTLATNISSAVTVTAKFSLSKKQENQTSHVSYIFATHLCILTPLFFSHDK